MSRAQRADYGASRAGSALDDVKSGKSGEEALSTPMGRPPYPQAASAPKLSEHAPSADAPLGGSE